MAAGKLDHDWNIASHLMAATINVFAPKGKAKSPRDLNPRAVSTGPAIKVSFAEAKALFFNQFVKKAEAMKEGG